MGIKEPDAAQRHLVMWKTHDLASSKCVLTKERRRHLEYDVVHLFAENAGAGERNGRVEVVKGTTTPTNRGTTTPTTTDKYLPCEQWRTVSTDLRQSRDGPRSRGSTNEIAGTFDAGMPALRRANNSSRSVTSSTVTEQQQLAEIAGTFDACSFQKRAGRSHWKLALKAIRWLRQ